MSDDGFRIEGTNAAADFTLTAHRGDGMVMLGMNWRVGEPPANFVGWQIQCRPPGAAKSYYLFNSLRFPPAEGVKVAATSDLSPFQRFRWVDFPDLASNPQGAYTYTVTPAFMDASGAITSGTQQSIEIALHRETYPGELDVSYTRGFWSSQGYERHFGSLKKAVIPTDADDPLTFTTASEAALRWLGFEAASGILDTLKAANADAAAKVKVVAYELKERHVLDALVSLGSRLQIVIDNSDPQGATDSPESHAETRLKGAGAAVVREKLGGLQHNKTIVVDSPTMKRVICGSTNFTWRGFYLQNNNAVTLTGANAVATFGAAFDRYFTLGKGATKFAATPSTQWQPLNLPSVDARVAFSPHPKAQGLLKSVADDILTAKSSVFYSLAFLYQTPGPIRDALKQLTDSDLFVYGMSDKPLNGFDLHKPDGNVAPVAPTSLGKNAPPGFVEELTRGKGAQLHHKFVVLDFDTPDARVYVGSFNFSGAADTSNGENLLLIKDRRVATSFLVEALSMFDHYSFRAKYKTNPFPPALVRPPAPSGSPWWKKYYVPGSKQGDRQLFA
jgi:phosphatidylserine/phosphatidylglycerophosphate/cardiolipin synthase-like enzyme